ncbi:uncharacterized protein IWZ02DRAFT_261690 [Phyllosticta citriasiana]|uniref:uncharacterized protein n=1 Tax=Phyllosticta citriasiana TaxID=595635 RepID=UPI0030FD8EEE
MKYNPASNGWHASTQADRFALSRRPLETFLLVVVSSAQSLYLMTSAASPFASSNHALLLPLATLIFPRTHAVLTSSSTSFLFTPFLLFCQVVRVLASSFPRLPFVKPLSTRGPSSAHERQLSSIGPVQPRDLLASWYLRIRTQ